MTMATVAGSLPEPTGRRFGKMTIDLEIPGGSFDQYPKPAQRILIYLWRASNFGVDEVRKTTKEMARACGRTERWVYLALRQCLDHFEGEGEGASNVPLIIKRFVKGPREAAGRVIKLLVNFAKPKKEKGSAGRKAGAKGNAKPAPASAPVPAAPVPAAPTDPTGPPEPPPPPGTFRRILDGLGGALTGQAAATRATKSEAELVAEANRKKAEFAAAAERRRAEAGRRKAASEGPDPKPRE